MNIILKPLSLTEIKERLEDESTYIRGVVPIGLQDIVDNDFETFLDILSENLIGNVCLMDINYKCVGIEDEGQTLLIEVSGDVSNVLDEDEYDEEQ